MKKKILAGLLASTAVAGLASCSEEVALVSKIDIANQDSVATFGETFADSDLVVTATMIDGTTKDVTAEANVDTTKVDTSKAGVYAVVVSYQGQSAVYYVTVNAPAPAATVSSIAVSGQNVSFKVGDKYANGNVKVTATYSDSTTKDVTTNAKIDASKVDTTKAGVYAVVVSYEGAYATYYVTVSEKEAPVIVTVSSIEVTGQNTKFTVGDTYAKGNLKVTATLSDETTEDVTASATVDTSKVDTTKAGVYAVLVSYEGCIATYYVTVEEPVVLPAPTLSSIEVTGQKTSFTVNDIFTSGELVVTATLSDETTQNVTANAKVDSSKVNTAVAGVYAVVVTYEDCSAIYYVTVNEPDPEATLVSIAISGQKTEFTVGDEFAADELVVKATYSDETVVDVTENAKIDASKVDTTKAGTYAVVVKYNIYTEIYYVTVAPAPVAVSIEVSADNENIKLGDYYEPYDITVTATYDNETTKDVTDVATFEYSTLDTEKAGVYTVIVQYESCVTYYTVTVVAPENEKTLIESNVNLEYTKTEYLLGQTVNPEDVVLYGYYENTEYPVTYEKVTNCKVTIVSVTDSEGNEVTKFEALGNYTVNVSWVDENEKECTFEYDIVVYDTIENLIKKGNENASKVVSGEITHYPNSDWSSTSSYEFGSDYFMSDTDGVKNYMSLNGEELFVVQDNWGDLYLNDYITDVNTLKGFEFSVLYNQYAYGVEDLVSKTYAAANGNFIFEGVKNGQHTFSFPYVAETEFEDIYYLIITVSFELDNENSFNNVYYCQEMYSGGEVTLDTDNNTWTPNEGIIPIVTDFIVSQTTGDRTSTNPYSFDNVTYTSFDLTDSEGNELPTEFNIMAGESVTLNIVKPSPATAIATLNDFVFDCENYVYGMIEGNNIIFNIYNPGTYEITICVGTIEKQVKIVAAQPAPESISVYASELVEGWWGTEYEMMETSSATIQTGDKLYVGAMITPEKASQEMTITLKEAYTGAVLSEVSYDDYDAPYFDGSIMTFSADAAGTYVVVFTSVLDNTISGELTVTVTEGQSSEPETQATFTGLWTAYNPKNPSVVMATIQVYDGGYAQFFDGMMTTVMVGYELDGTSITFNVPPAFAGTLGITDVTVDEDYTSMTANVTLNGETVLMTFTKPATGSSE